MERKPYGMVYAYGIDFRQFSNKKNLRKCGSKIKNFLNQF